MVSGLSATLTLLILCVTPGALASLRVDSYPNAAISGAPSSTTFTDNLEFSLSEFSGSAEVSGQITFPSTEYVSFNCTFEGGQIVFVWVDDHLICHTSPPFGNSPSSTDGSPQQPLSVRASQRLHVLVHVYAASNGSTTSTDTADVTVKWAQLAAPLGAGALPAVTSMPESIFSPNSSAAELERRSLQQSLKQGWNTWSYNMLGVVRLPQSFVLTTAVCKQSTQECLTETHIEDPAASIRVGVFSTNQSYWQFYLGYQGINISLSVTGGLGTLNLLVDPVNCDTANCSDYAVVVMPRFAWFRPGQFEINPNGTIGLTGLAFEQTLIHPSKPPDVLTLPTAVNTAPHVGFNLGSGAVGIREGTVGTLTEIQDTIEAARSAELARYAAYGELADVKEALQSATLWNYIYTPAEYGPFLPVSRSWNFVKEQVNSDWSYVIFDWDNIFAAYMTSLDPSSKHIAYSNFIQVIRSKTARGFVPNYSAGGSKSVDRTEPPIGAKVLLEMYNKYKDAWLVELLFDDLLAWSDWFATDRALGPLGLISLGSDTVAGYGDFSPGTMQGARFESGLDNSPMYDGDFFVANLSSSGSFAVGQMQLYDVGMASMFVQEADALAALAAVAGRGELSANLTARATAQRELIRENLWDDQGGIFTNRFWNGSFYRRISPTSFYSMMAGAASDEQATAMVQNWLLSPDHFCVAPNGDFAGNHDDCYWGLPSIQRADPAYPPLGYWRGYVWGPMAQLTYWSLQQYDHVPAVRSARKALCSQMTALMLSQWNEHRHICENFSPHKTADDHHGDCSGTKFYHWGALTGMITLIEQGHY